MPIMNITTNNKQYYIDSGCGTGKTTRMIQTISDTTDARYLIMQPTHELLQQTASRMRTQGISGIKVIDSAGAYNSTVEHCINAINDQNNRVIMCTGITGFRLTQKNFIGLRVWIDDIPDVTASHTPIVVDKATDRIADLLDIKPHESGKYCTFTASDKIKSSDLKRAASAVILPSVAYDTMCMLNDVSDENVKQLQVMYYYDITKLNTADEIVWLRSNFTKSMVYLCFSSTVDFVPYPVSSIINTVNPFDRLRVFHYMQNGQRYSGSFQERYPDQVHNMIRDIRNRVHADTTISTCNQDKINEYNLPGKYVSPCSQGSNDYIHADTAVWMTSMLPSSSEVAIYKAVFGDHITQDDIAYARCYDYLIQYVFRTVIRDPLSTVIVSVYVPDEFMARALHPNPTLIPGVVQNTAKKIGRPSVNVDPSLQRRVSDFRRNTPISTPEYLTKAKKWINKQIQKYGPSCADYLQEKLLK
jgi:hypothetical protein